MNDIDEKFDPLNPQWEDREYELMDKVLTVVIESSHIDGKIDLGNLIEKRHEIRMKMFKGDKDE